MVRFSRASIVFVLISAGLHAWDGTGHQMVASVAFRHMNQQSRDRLLILLRRHPKFACWTAGVPAGDNAQLLESAIREAAIWPDSIKSLASGSTDPLPHCYTAADRVGERAYRSDGDSYGTDLQSKTSAALNIGYTDHLMHEYWHFDDLPIAPTPAIAATRPHRTSTPPNGSCDFEIPLQDLRPQPPCWILSPSMRYGSSISQATYISRFTA